MRLVVGGGAGEAARCGGRWMMLGRVRRLEPLDGLRGIAAIGFALGSWGAYSAWAGVDFVRNLQLSADFILIVAGFIVSRAHRDQLAESYRVGRYLFARFGRHFPLHAGALALLLFVDGLVGVTGGLPGFLESLFLTHIFTMGAMEWNPAAWIVAAELWMSFLFAGVCMLGILSNRWGRLVVFGVICALVTIRYNHTMESAGAIDLAIRGAVAFLLGALLQATVANRSVTIALRKTKKAIGTPLEIYGIVSIVAFFAFAPESLAPFAPLIFGSCLFIFLRLKCAVSDILDGPLPQKLGELSYAVILTHLLLVTPLAELVSQSPEGAFGFIAIVGAPMFVISALALAYLAHRVFDKPTRKAMSEWADHVFPERPEYDYDDDGGEAFDALSPHEPPDEPEVPLIQPEKRGKPGSVLSI